MLLFDEKNIHLMIFLSEVLSQKNKITFIVHKTPARCAFKNTFFPNNFLIKITSVLV